MCEPKPIQIGRNVLNSDQLAQSLSQKTGLEIPFAEDLHVTLVWSRHAVDWSLPCFQPQQDTLELPKEGYWVTGFEGAPLWVLEFKHEGLTERNRVLFENGARSDFPEFRPHISFSKRDTSDLARGPDFTFDHPILLGPEYVKPAKL